MTDAYLGKDTHIYLAAPPPGAAVKVLSPDMRSFRFGGIANVKSEKAQGGPLATRKFLIDKDEALTIDAMIDSGQLAPGEFDGDAHRVLVRYPNDAILDAAVFGDGFMWDTPSGDLTALDISVAGEGAFRHGEVILARETNNASKLGSEVASPLALADLAILVYKAPAQNYTLRYAWQPLDQNGVILGNEQQGPLLNLHAQRVALIEGNVLFNLGQNQYGAQHTLTWNRAGIGFILYWAK